MNYKLEPKNCELRGINMVRPFHLDGEEVYAFNIDTSLNDEKGNEENKKQLDRFCKAISDKIGILLTHKELLEAIKSRIIYGKEN